MANYTLIGGDQKQYGPVPDEQLRQWICDGRVIAQSQVKAEGDAEWRSVSALPEFAKMFGSETGGPAPLSFITLFCRYIAAIAVALGVSFALCMLQFIVLMVFGLLGVPDSLIENLHIIIFSIVAPIIGFCGVFSGSLCLEQSQRRFGSIFLLFVGLAFYIFLISFTKSQGGGDYESHPYGWLLGVAALTLGGLVAVTFVFRRSSPNKGLGCKFPSATARQVREIISASRRS
jgi:hypothetical protein